MRATRKLEEGGATEECFLDHYSDARSTYNSTTHKGEYSMKSKQTVLNRRGRKAAEKEISKPKKQVKTMADTPEQQPVVASAAEDAAVRPQKKVSKALLTLERVKQVRAELEAAGKNSSQRSILKILGGSFSTISKVMERIEQLDHDPIDVSITVSDATRDAISADIMRHLEQFQASVKNKLALVDAIKKDLHDAAKTIKSQQQAISDQRDEINKLVAINEELLKALDKK
jgi:hypothetical protein